MTYIKSGVFLFLFFLISFAQAKVINIECDLKMTISTDWASSDTDNQKEVWTYDDQKGLRSAHTQYLLKECKLGEEELVCEKYTIQNTDQANAFYEKTYLNRYNLLLKDYSEKELTKGQFSSRMREGTCSLIN
jgi:hypothetical protein